MAAVEPAPPDPSDDCLSAVEQSAWRGLMCAHAALVKQLDAELERAHALGLTSVEVLQRLAEAPGRRMRMRDLADAINLSRSGLTRLVDRLERDRLLERCSCQHDARGAYACLTDEGERKLVDARATHLAGVRAHLTARLAPEELRVLGVLWERLRCDDGAPLTAVEIASRL